MNFQWFLEKKIGFKVKLFTLVLAHVQAQAVLFFLAACASRDK